MQGSGMPARRAAHGLRAPANSCPAPTAASVAAFDHSPLVNAIDYSTFGANLVLVRTPSNLRRGNISAWHPRARHDVLFACA